MGWLLGVTSMCSCRMCHREAGRPRRLMPTVERLMGMWCGCCGFVRYQETLQVRFFKRLPFCHPVKWPLAADLDLQPTPWSCMHCQSLPVFALACSTHIPGVSASSRQSHCTFCMLPSWSLCLPQCASHETRMLPHSWSLCPPLSHHYAPTVHLPHTAQPSASAATPVGGIISASAGAVVFTSTA